MAERPDKGLTARNEAFVHHYLESLNATQAAIKAGYSAETAGSIGSRLLKNVKVAAAIAQGMALRSMRTEFTQDQVLRELGRIGFSDMRQFVRWGMTDLTQPDEDAYDIGEEFEGQPHGGALKRRRKQPPGGPDDGAPESKPVAQVRDRVPYAEFVPSLMLDAESAAAISEITVTTTYTREGEPKVQTRLKLHDKVAALTAIAKHLGMGQDKQDGIQKYLDLSKLSDEQLERLAHGDDPLKVLLGIR